MDIVFGLIANAICNGLSSKLKDFMQRTHIESLMKDLQKNAASKTIASYQDEPYYNAIDSYFTSNNIVSNLIRTCYNKNDPEFQTSKFFSLSHTNKFTELNNNFLWKKSDIYDIFLRLYETIDSVVNNCLCCEEVRITTNKLAENDANSQMRHDELIKKNEELQNQIVRVADYLLINNSSIMSASSDIASVTDEIHDQYYQKIKDIINENQDNEKLRNGIDELNNVIQDIAGDVSDMSTANRAKLLLFTHDTLALFYVNDGDIDKALQSIERAEKLTKRLDNAECNRHYFINAYVLTHSKHEDKYNAALELLNKITSFNDTDHKAFLLKIKIESILSISSYDMQITKLEKFFNEYIEKSDDDLQVAEYYQTLGFVNLQYAYYEDAIAALEKSQEIFPNIVNEANMAITYYSWATADCEKDVQVVRPAIDYSKMIRCIDIISSLLDRSNELYASLRNSLIPIYILASNFCGQHENVVYVAERFDSSDFDYETNRTIALGKVLTGISNNDNVDELTPEDQFFLRMVEEKSDDDAIEILETGIQAVPRENAGKLFQALLGLYIRKKDVERYKDCLKQMNQAGFKDSYSDLHDMLVAEMSGNIDEAKLIAEKCIGSSLLDTSIIFGIIDFFKRHCFAAELIDFLLKIHSQVRDNKLLFDRLDIFYRNAIQFLVDECYTRAAEVFNELPRQRLSEEVYYHFAVMIFAKVNDHVQMSHALGKLYELRQYPHDKIMQAQSCKAICENDKAEQLLLDILDLPTLTVEEKSICYDLLSEIYLYKEDYENSYKYAKLNQELNDLIPTHHSHAVLWMRSIQCDKIDEGFSTAIKHKRKHPVVVDWQKEIKLPVDDDGNYNPEELLSVLTEATGGPYNFKIPLDYYNSGKLSLYHICESAHLSINNVLSWRETYNLQPCIFSGNLEMLIEEANYHDSEVVVDALSLLMIAKLDLLFLLNAFDKVRVTSSTVEKLQYEYLDSLSNRAENYACKVLKLLSKSEKFVIYPDAPDISKKARDYYISRYLYDAISHAMNHGVCFLYADATILQYIELVFPETVKYISIPALLKNHQPQEEACLYRYHLLKQGYRFINFNSLDMYYHLSSNEFCFSTTDIKPFFKCKSAHDMMSYGRVYCALLKRLIEEKHEKCAIDFAKYVFYFLDKTELRSRYYLRSYTEEYSFSSIDEFKYQTMVDFVLRTLNLFMYCLYQSGEPYYSLANSYQFKNIPKYYADKSREVAVEKVISEL